MPERPALKAQGTIRQIRESGRLYEIEMPNGYHALAVLPHNTPSPPADPIGQQVDATFSPYDLSSCKITRWVDQTK